MATENVTSTKKYRILTDAVNKKWDVIPFWTTAASVDMGDGTTLATLFSKIKDILGITDKLNITTKGYALDATQGKVLNDAVKKAQTDASDALNKYKALNITGDVNTVLASKITYGSTALTAGTSSLETGKFYFQYK